LHIIYASADEPTIDPSMLVEVLSNSKYLKGENLSGYKISLFGYYKADNYAYQDYFDNLYNPSSTGNKIKLSRNYLLPI
jgi:hypothetical protein